MIEFQIVIIKVKNIKVENKKTQLNSVLSQSLSGNMNLARKKYVYVFL